MTGIEALDILIAEFTKLPGVGRKTATRYAYAVLEMPKEEVDCFASALAVVQDKVHFCSLCGNYTEGDVCDICQSRDKSVICVVKEPQDAMAFEKVKDYKGVYHVLHGALDPLRGVGVNDIRIKELLSRLDGVKEVIMATNPDAEGEATALYIARLIKPLGVKVTRLAHGLPIGSDIEYADEVTLGRALSDRKDM